MTGDAGVTGEAGGTGETGATAEAREPGVTLDLNADVGEGFGVWSMGDDEALLSLVTSANVACGFHGGDPSIMRRVCRVAVASGVAIGAHVSYRDLIGFGRRSIDVDPSLLRDEVLYQLGALRAVAGASGGAVRYVKAHGALYHASATDDRVAGALVGAMIDAGGDLMLLCQVPSACAEVALTSGVAVVSEGYLDRGYQPDGRLVPRDRPGAVLVDPDRVVARAVEVARSSTLRAVDGTVIDAAVRSLCVHGDTPGAVHLARQVRAALEEAGARLAPFAER